MTINLDKLTYPARLPLIERQEVIYRAFIFNRLYQKIWPNLFIQSLKEEREGRFLDYFLVSFLVRKDSLLRAFFLWLIEAGECPLEINDSLHQEAMNYAIECIKRSLNLSMKLPK